MSLSGTLALIGAYQDDTGASNAGSAYLFDTTTGNLLQTFNNPSPQFSDQFGKSVSLSGTLALIGTPADSTGASGAGSAYLFDTTTGNLLQTFNNPSPQLSDNFGNSVSLSGTLALIGAPSDNTGATKAGSAYLYQGSEPVPQTVPEPSFTILGAGVVLGALPVLKKGKKTKDKDA
ncbi:Quinoprotein (fragment) [Microcystis aeruginosa PCC 9443]|uniref:Quinoprotein n=1 Tax=Microcystis aeruginosa PCC 9443 TaxID=1160281 RepID=I4GAU3_MICAE